MSEYIPREEAVDAIIKLAKELREVDDGLMAGGAIYASMKVEKVPRADVISVEWLQEQRDRVYDIPRRGHEMVRIIDGLLAMWNKEQMEDNG